MRSRNILTCARIQDFKNASALIASADRIVHSVQVRFKKSNFQVLFYDKKVQEY